MTATAWQPTIIEGPLLSWRSQARQYPAGVHQAMRYGVAMHRLLGRWTYIYVIGDAHGERLLRPAEHRGEDWTDCLLMYGPSGKLWGILNHYPVDNRWERAGNVNLWVHPGHQRRGVGRALLAAARLRWDVNPRQQRYTPAGYALARTIWPDLPPPA